MPCGSETEITKIGGADQNRSSVIISREPTAGDLPFIRSAGKAVMPALLFRGPQLPSVQG